MRQGRRGRLSGASSHVVGRHGDVPPEFYDMPPWARAEYIDMEREAVRKERAEQTKAKREKAKKEKAAQKKSKPKSKVYPVVTPSQPKKKKIHKNGIRLGSVVKIWNLEDYLVETITLVDAAQSDPIDGKISIETPVAQALLGHRAGDFVDVEVSGEKLRYKVMEILSL